MKRLMMSILLGAAASSAFAGQPTSLFQGLISFRDGPDPAGQTPVYWATSQALHGIVSPHAAEVKFGSNWVSQIRWCGTANRKPLPGECSDIYYNFRHGSDITEFTPDLLHP